MNNYALQFYKTNNGPCPYRPEGTWENLSFYTEHLTGAVYESLLNQGFRRSGYSVYHPICQSCQHCIPIRINTSQFVPSKGQRRTWRKNQDLRIVHYPLTFIPESFQLYQRYQMSWHQTEELPTEKEYQHFLLESPVNTEMIHYYLGDVLIGVGWVDKLPSILSSIYFIFDPEYAARRLGVFSILYELNYSLQLGHEWLYLGYWVENSPKMQYKAEYRPAEILMDEQWMEIDTYKAK